MNTSESLLNSVAYDNLLQIGSNSAEIALDSILESGLVKEIPILGTLYKIGKTGLAIKERIFAKKIYQFLYEIKDLSPTKRADFVIELEQHEKGRQKAGETLLILLDRLNHLEKSKIIGKLLKAKILEKIDLETFLRLSNAVADVYIDDLPKLKSYIKENNPDNYYNPYQIYVSNGLLTYGLIVETEILFNTLSDHYFEISDLGRLLLKYGIEK